MYSNYESDVLVLDSFKLVVYVSYMYVYGWENNLVEKYVCL